MINPMTNPNLTDGQGPNPDASGYTPGTKSHALNEIHCMLQELQQIAEGLIVFDFDKAYELIETVRDNEGA